MNIFIQSTLSGTAAGHIEVYTEADSTVDSLVSHFCIEKGVRYKQQYILKDKNNVILDKTRTLTSYNVSPGDVFLLTTRNEELQVFGFSNWWVLCGVALIIGLIGTVTVIIVYSIPGPIPFGHGIVFDGGSTHTEMILYKWEGEKENGTAEVNEVTNCIVNGSGISSFASNPSQAGPSLEPCLTVARNMIPSEQHFSSPVFLGATGGMRILNETNATVASEILASVAKTLKSSGLRYHSGHAAIISGLDEGLYGWITANYLYRTLTQFKRTDQSKTVGALDLGGASMQISFEHTRELGPASDFYSTVNLYGTKYTVFSRSYLCFGKKEAERRFKVNLILDNKIDLKNETIQVDNPCGLVGELVNVTISNLFNQPCTVPLHEHSVSMDKNISFKGIGEPKKCADKIKDILDPSICNNANFTYCLNVTENPDVRGKFVAFSAYYYVMNYFNMTKNATKTEFESMVNLYCKKNWSEVNWNPPPPVPAVLLREYCFDGQYILGLLFELGFGNWTDLTFQDSKQNVSLGWALGFMTARTNAIPAESPVRSLGVTVFAMLLVLFAIFLICAVAFGHHGWRQKHRNTSYQRNIAIYLDEEMVKFIEFT